MDLVMEELPWFYTAGGEEEGEWHTILFFFSVFN